MHKEEKNKSEKEQNSEELAWCSQPGLGTARWWPSTQGWLGFIVLLWNINNITEKLTVDKVTLHNAGRQKQDHSIIIMCTDRKESPVQMTEITQ